MKKSSSLSETKPDLSELEKELPPILFRNNPRFKELIGLSPRTLANMDSLGIGIAERILIGNVVGYPRRSLISWLEARSRIFAES
jgi:hypothetical protein